MVTISGADADADGDEGRCSVASGHNSELSSQLCCGDVEFLFASVSELSLERAAHCFGQDCSRPTTFVVLANKAPGKVSTNTDVPQN